MPNPIHIDLRRDLPKVREQLEAGEALLKRLNYFATNLLHAGHAAGDPLFASKVEATCNNASAWLIDELRPALFQMIAAPELYEALAECVAAREEWINSTTDEGDVAASERIGRAQDRALAALAKAQGK